jgi:hypothetical protein
MKKICLLVLLLLNLSVFNLVQAESAESAPVMMTEVLFEQSESGIEPYTVRLLVTANKLRIDDGNDQDPQGYILYDRISHEIHNFNHDDQSHLLMKPLVSSAIDFKLEFRQDKKVLEQAPRIKGEAAIQSDFYADGQLCKTSINVSGLLPDVTTALKDYEQMLVQQNKQTLSEIPAAVRTPCYMSNNYLHASEYLKTGFPLHVIDDQGRQRRLMKFGEVSKPLQLLQQIQGYRLYYPNPSNL